MVRGGRFLVLEDGGKTSRQVFLGFRRRLACCSHSSASLRAFCVIVWRRGKEGAEQTMVESSAYCINETRGEQEWSEFERMLNRSGPRTEPWGTPVRTFRKGEVELSHLTAC